MSMFFYFNMDLRHWEKRRKVQYLLNNWPIWKSASGGKPISENIQSIYQYVILTQVNPSHHLQAIRLWSVYRKTESWPTVQIAVAKDTCSSRKKQCSWPPKLGKWGAGLPTVFKFMDSPFEKKKKNHKKLRNYDLDLKICCQNESGCRYY